MTYINIIVTAIFHIFHKMILQFVEEKKIEQATILFRPYITKFCVQLSCCLNWSATAKF